MFCIIWSTHQIRHNQYEDFRQIEEGFLADWANSFISQETWEAIILLTALLGLIDSFFWLIMSKWTQFLQSIMVL